MSNKLTDKTTSDTQPSTLVAIIGGAVKLLNWSGLTTLLGALYAPIGRTINGHSLNANVTITKSDVTLGNVTNDAQLKAADLDTDATMAANSDTKVPSQKAVKAYADSAAAAAAAAVVDSSPSTLNTLNELAAALGGDASFAATVATSLGNKQDKSTLGSDVATAVHAATGKSTPVDGDELLITDSAASYAPKKLTWANLKATLKTYFDTVYAALAHAARHKSGGADAIKLDELDAPTDVTTLNATTSAHGLLPKLGGGTTNFLRADGSWAAPAGGGGGASFVTGMEMDYAIDAAPAGWVRKNGLTIGNASSSATERANDDTADLYALLWNNYGDSQCPVAGGRGSDAASDFAGNKTLTLPNATGRASIPKTGSGVFGNLGEALGEESHALTEGENGTHSHSHQYSIGASSITTDTKGYSAGDTTVVISAGADTASTQSSGSGTPHNNIQPSVVTGCRIIKL